MDGDQSCVGGCIQSTKSGCEASTGWGVTTCHKRDTTARSSRGVGLALPMMQLPTVLVAAPPMPPSLPSTSAAVAAAAALELIRARAATQPAGKSGKQPAAELSTLHSLSSSSSSSPIMISPPPPSPPPPSPPPPWPPRLPPLPAPPFAPLIATSHADLAAAACRRVVCDAMRTHAPDTSEGEIGGRR